jgi:PAS domain S-box-containing protein
MVLMSLHKKHTNGSLDEIIENEERYRSIVNSSIDMVLVVDSNGKIISWNNSAERNFLYTEKEILGKPLTIIMPERYRDAHIKGLHRVTSTGESKVIGKTVELHGLRKDGSEFPIELSLSSWKTDKETFYGGIIRNITERKNSEVEYKTILRTAMDSFLLVDTRGHILDVNDSYCSLIGYSRDELLNMGVKDVEAEETEELIAQRIQRIMKVGWERFETRHKCKYGRIIDLEASINYSEIGGGKFFIFLRDITERKRTEKIQKKSQQRTQALLELFKKPHGTEEEFIAFAIEETIKLTESELGFIGFIDEHETIMQAHLWSARAMQACAIDNKPVQFSLKEGGLWTEAVKQHQNIIINDYSNPNPYKKGYPSGHVPLYRFIGIPLIRDGRTLLICGLANKNEEFDENDILQVEVFLRSVWDRISKLRAEQALSKSEARLLESQRTAHLGNWEWNVKTNELYWSEENYRIFGLSRDVRLSVEVFLNTVHPDDLKFVQKSIDGALHGKPYDVDMRIIRPDGQERIVNAKGEVCFDGENKPIRMNGTVQDITGRKHGEESLRLFRDLIDKSNDAIYIVDAETGIILDTNEKASSSLGYTRDELLNMHVYDFEVTLPDTFSWKEHVEEVQKEGSLVLEGKHRRKDATIFPVEVSVSFFEYANKSRIVAIVRDITERKKTEEMSRENEHLVYASKAKNDFLSKMSHELRTPLNAVIGFSELLKMKKLGNLTELQESYVDNIRYGGRHLLNVISDILDFSKIDAGKMELVIENISVPETLNQTIVMVEEMANKNNVSIIKELAPELEFIEADKQRFIQILFNLLSNAIKFNRKKGGTVTVTTKTEGDMAKFSVSDTGIGIKEENKNKLFNDFEQLDSGISRKYGGAGLGLVITKKLVELHGGKIWVESEFGVGSTFTFLLPIKANKGENK